MLYSVVINRSHQFENQCILGDKEGDHVVPIADYVHKRLNTEGKVKSYLIGPAPKTLKSDKDRLNWSVAEANKIKADIHIAIHTNAGGGSGAESIYYSDGPKYAAGKKLAKCIQSKLATIFKDRGIYSNKNLKETRGTNKPAVICECGFHDYKSDAKIIHSVPKNIGDLIVNGIYEYFGIDDVLYIVQTGAFKNKSNAELLARNLEAHGFSAIIKSS